MEISDKVMIAAGLRADSDAPVDADVITDADAFTEADDEPIDIE